jgi:hypothetical protein
MMVLPSIHVGRGDVEEAVGVLGSFDGFRESADVQERACYRAAEALVLRAQGEDRAALEAVRETIGAMGVIGANHEAVKLALVEGTEAAFALGDAQTAAEFASLIESLGVGRTVPMLRSLARRIRARLGPADASEVERLFKEAEALVRDADLPYWVAWALTEHGEWLVGQDRRGDAKPVLEEAHEIFERLGAKPWLTRVEAASNGG